MSPDCIHVMSNSLVRVVSIYIVLSISYLQLLNDFTEKITRICEGIYDRKVPTDQRLLIWTRPFMEDFATVVSELMPGIDNLLQPVNLVI